MMGDPNLGKGYEPDAGKDGQGSGYKLALHPLTLTIGGIPASQDGRIALKAARMEFDRHLSRKQQEFVLAYLRARGNTYLAMRALAEVLPDAVPKGTTERELRHLCHTEFLSKPIVHLVIQCIAPLIRADRSLIRLKLLGVIEGSDDPDQVVPAVKTLLSLEPSLVRKGDADDRAPLSREDLNRALLAARRVGIVRGDGSLVPEDRMPAEVADVEAAAR